MRRGRVIASVFLLLFGTFALLSTMSNPRVEALHGSDVVRLIASGLCFGVGLALLLRPFTFRGE
jgi:hypothetical protein